MKTFDTIISNARVIDGTGSPWYTADVALANEKIAAIGNMVAASAHTRIDAENRILCPGFIEIHGHSDATLLINPRAESAVHLGITTECTGNCGSSLFPVTENNVSQIFDHFRPFDPEFHISWATLSELKNRYENQGCAVNIVPLVGHGTVKTAVTGTAMQPAAKADLKQMIRLAEEAMTEGARGISSGLEYPPGSASTAEELIALIKSLKKYRPLYATHIRNRDVRYREAVAEAIDVGHQAAVTVQISHNVAKIGAPEGIMFEVLQMIEKARQSGLDVAFDVGAYLGGQTTPLGSLPPWAFDGGPQATLKHLADPQSRAKMRAYPYPIWRIVKLGMWEKIRLASSTANRHLVGKTFDDIAREQHKDPWDVLFDLLLAEGGWFFRPSVGRRNLHTWKSGSGARASSFVGLLRWKNPGPIRAPVSKCLSSRLRLGCLSFSPSCA